MALPSLRRWRAPHLLAAWIAYWVALAAVVLGRPAFALWRLTHDAARHGRFTASANNDVITLALAERGAPGWTYTTHLLTIALWLVLPPLVLFVAWLRARPAPAMRGADPAPVGPGLPSAGTPSAGVRAPGADRASPRAGPTR